MVGSRSGETEQKSGKEEEKATDSNGHMVQVVLWDVRVIMFKVKIL